MTGAAKALGKSQPVITRLIQDLEQELGFPILHRKRSADSADGAWRGLLCAGGAVLERIAHDQRTCPVDRDSAGDAYRGGVDPGHRREHCPARPQ
ncbi:MULTISPECIES: LysR family transcriptional regulator [Neorhizobium]|nr:MULTISPECIES: LysR family transcriptional regulator [Neorhizobium]